MRFITLMLIFSWSSYSAETKWPIKIEEPIKVLSKSIDPAKQSQMELTIGHNNLASLYNAKLKIMYFEILTSLSKDAEIERFRSEQEDWLKKRKSSVIEISKGPGSIKPMLAAIEYIEITKKRISTLEKLHTSRGEF